MNPDSFDTAVLVGRFQPFHKGHLALLLHALASAPQVVVVLGSACQARTPRNPWTWQERAAMVEAAVTPEQAARIRFLPVRDWYDEARWAQAVRQGVAQLLPQGAGRVALVGHLKDDSSTYLRGFEGWTLLDAQRAGDIDGVALRDLLLGHGPAAAQQSLQALSASVPAGVLAILRAWCEGPFLAELAREWSALRANREAWAGSPYPVVFVTVDAVVTCAGRVLLIRRGQPPGVGLYAVPGGFIEQRETAWQSALRELREETRLDLSEDQARACLRGSAVFDHPDRSQRGRTITHAFHFELALDQPPAVQADDDAQSAAWVPISEVAALEDRFHDDHFHMLDRFLGLLGQPSAGK
jgi:bifunctional NMN adenylyltransferase/nudix hydrolase